MALVGLGTRTRVAIQRHVTHSKPSRIVRRDNAPSDGFLRVVALVMVRRSLRRWFAAHWPATVTRRRRVREPSGTAFRRGRIDIVASPAQHRPLRCGNVTAFHAGTANRQSQPLLPRSPQRVPLAERDMGITCRARRRRRTGCLGWSRQTVLSRQRALAVPGSLQESGVNLVSKRLMPGAQIMKGHHHE